MRARSYVALAAGLLAGACRPAESGSRDGVEETVTRPSGVAATWVHHAPRDLAVEWWAPPSFPSVADTRGLPPCDSTTPPADSGIAAMEAEQMGLPLSVHVRRGAVERIVNANHFGVGEGGGYYSEGRGSGETAVQEGPGWIALAGEVWVGHFAEEGGLIGQEPVHVLLGIADAGRGCRLVFLERGYDNITGLDTLAAVLATVRPRSD